MRRRFFITGFLVVISILLFRNPTYSQAEANNPFTDFDIKYENKLGQIKDDSSGEFPLTRRQLSTIESKEEGFMVKFKNDTPMEEVFNIVSNYEYSILGNSENRHFIIKSGDMEAFRTKAQNTIEHIERDSKKEGHFSPSDPYYQYQWGIPAINIPQAWTISKGSNSVYVAVIDSGIDRNHPDLINTDIRQGYDYIRRKACDMDFTGHGTEVTGIIAAQTNNGIGISGINWDVAIIPMRVSYSDGSIDTSYVVEAIYDAANIGTDVINISLGGLYYSYSEQLAINYALEKGSIVISSAGNSGSSYYNYPASYDGVISVGSVDRNLKHSSFSQINNAVDVVAPGQRIYTTRDSSKQALGSYYGYVDGTSFSAPHVSGVAALMQAVKPSMTYYDFMEYIEITSTDLGTPGYDNYYGHGLINAEKMLEIVSPKRVWLKSNDKWYFFDEDGLMQTGWLKTAGKWYYLNDNGVMQTGWLRTGGKWYYLNSSGAMETGWQRISGKWYFLNASGVMRTGWLNLGGRWYYLNSSGAMQTGWLQTGGRWYYLLSSGVMQTGWQRIGGRWYYLYTNGSMAANTTIGGYRLSSSGAML